LSGCDEQKAVSVEPEKFLGTWTAYNVHSDGFGYVGKSDYYTLIFYSSGFWSISVFFRFYRCSVSPVVLFMEIFRFA
jgi:hypothetical protein